MLDLKSGKKLPTPAELKLKASATDVIIKVRLACFRYSLILCSLRPNSNTYTTSHKRLSCNYLKITCTLSLIHHFALNLFLSAR